MTLPSKSSSKEYNELILKDKLFPTRKEDFMEIQGKVAIVSGGASGLGLACVRQCVQAGAKVVILDFDGTKGEAVAAEIGNNVVFCKTDVTSEKDVKSAV